MEKGRETKTYTNPDGSTVQIPISVIIKSLQSHRPNVHISPQAALLMGNYVCLVQNGDGEIFIGDEVCIENNSLIRSDNSSFKAIGRTNLGENTEIYVGDKSRILLKDESRIGSFSKISVDSNSSLELSNFALLENGSKEQHAKIFVDTGTLIILGNACIAPTGTVMVNNRSHEIGSGEYITEMTRPGFYLVQTRVLNEIHKNRSITPKTEDLRRVPENSFLPSENTESVRA